MRQLLERFAWRFRRRRLVRLHHQHMDASLEGVLVGVWAGHYILRVAKIIEREDVSRSFDGPEVRVPAGHVLFVEVLA